jgi:hypothetical protein
LALLLLDGWIIIIQAHLDHYTNIAHPPGPTGPTGPCGPPPRHYPIWNTPILVSKKELIELLKKYPDTQTHTQKGTDSNPNPVWLELDSTTYWKEIPILIEFDQRTSTLSNSGFGARSDVCPYVEDFKQWSDRSVGVSKSDAVNVYVPLCVGDIALYGVEGSELVEFENALRLRLLTNHLNVYTEPVESSDEANDLNND